MFINQLKCVRCGRVYPLDKTYMYNCGECGGILEVEYNYKRLRINDLVEEMLKRKRMGVWKYRELLPIEDYSKIVSLGEGGTELLQAERLGREIGVEVLYLKNETNNPTGSFKDRPTTVGITKAKEIGADTVIATSSGNAGAALAAYAAKGGMRAIVLVPVGTPWGKLSQIIACGAKVVAVKGSCSDTYKLAKMAAQEYSWINLTTTFLSPYPTEGDKTVAYEICEQLDWRVPHWMLVPISAGPLLVGSFRGFLDFKNMGLINDLPAMVGVQAEGCAPIVKAFERNQVEVQPWPEPKTIASGISDPLLSYSQDGTYTLQIIRESRGRAVAVSDEEILQAIRLMAESEGIFAEPAGAAPIAGLRRLVKNGQIDRKSSVVCLVTGHGLKDLKVVEAISAVPLVIEPEIKELKKALESKGY